ncbi:hypothetical protein [Embleya sp. MST-111070]|uniref:hypothetical protein n=1 Tax=Embleya sp. MST-111070 TaxID=3398231 RepID=UPI003F731583
MTRTGSDHLKRTARRIARATGRRYPDVLRELRRESRATPLRQPSTELVRVCAGMAHPIEPGRCARPAGHEGSWSWCSSDPHLPSRIWEGYHRAADEARRIEEAQRLAALTPAEREAYEAESEAAYWEDMAAEAREPDDPYEDKYRYDDGAGPGDDHDARDWNGDCR